MTITRKSHNLLDHTHLLLEYSLYGVRGHAHIIDYLDDIFRTQWLGDDVLSIAENSNSHLHMTRRQDYENKLLMKKKYISESSKRP